MTLYDKRRKKISEELKDKEYRDIFVEEKINIGIPFQIRALRGELTQKEFGELFGINQEEISRYENINYSRFSLSTLKKLARAFDVGLMVRFVSFSELVEHDLTLSSESLKAVSFPEDSYFKEEPKEEFQPAVNVSDNFSITSLSNTLEDGNIARNFPLETAKSSNSQKIIPDTNT